MKVENPSPEVIAAVKGAVKWFEKHKITDTAYIRKKDKNGKRTVGKVINIVSLISADIFPSELK